MSGPILTVTLNPAIDISADVGALAPGIKLRCDTARYEPGGGGVNVSRVIKELGGQSSAFLVAGGPTGDWLRTMLAEAGIECRLAPIAGLTRTDFHVFERDSGEMYRFVLPGPEIGARALAGVIRSLDQEMEARSPAFVVMSGSLPRGVSGEIVGSIGARCRDRGAHLIVDSRGETLAHLAGSGAYLIKPNREELEELRVALGLDAASVEATARAVIAQNLAHVVVVTLGADGAVVVTAKRVLELPALQVSQNSAIGAGDSFIAGLVLGLSRGEPLEEAVAYGMAAGAAAAMTPGSALARREDVDALVQRLRTQPRG